jgi:hypothetical protein
MGPAHRQPTQYEDLFWDPRGRHTFGVVTSFEYRLHPGRPGFGGLVIHPLSEAVNVLRFYRDFTASQPDELRDLGGHPDDRTEMRSWR